MEITVNGVPEHTGHETLEELVRSRGLETGALIVEHNFKVIPKETWDQTRLQPGDTIELLSFVGGG